MPTPPDSPLRAPLHRQEIRVRRPRWLGARRRAWREWCFARSLFERLWLRLVILGGVLITGAAMFMALEPERRHTFPEALFQTYSLVFANPAQDFPDHWALQALFFAVPVVGLTVIIDAIVELATLVQNRQRNERAWCRIMAESMKEHVIVVGLGRLGYRTWSVLHRLGIPTVVLEVDEHNQFLSDVRREGIPLFLGDARRESLLVDANIADAKAIILATTDDLANLEIALDARKLNPRVRVVLRMFDQNLADKVREGFHIPTAMSESALSAPAFATAALEEGIVASAVIDNRLIVTAEGAVAEGGELAGKTVAQVLAEARVQVIRWHGLASAEPRLFPLADTALASNDHIVFQGLHQDVRRVLSRGWVN